MALLSLGDHGSSVRNLQTRLQQAGYQIQVDGEFGGETDRVVRQFQRDHRADFNLAEDGIVGSETRGALRSILGQDAFEPSGVHRPPTTINPNAPVRRTGAQRWRELQQFAEDRGFHVTSSTGGHHLGAAHREGRAVDVRTRDHTPAQVEEFMRQARQAGYTVIDERGGGNAAWTGAHVHLQVN